MASKIDPLGVQNNILAGHSFDDDGVPFRPVPPLENSAADDIIARVQEALS